MGTQSIFLIIAVVAIVLFMFRNGRKRSKDAAALADSLKPGAEVMTTFGVFGTVQSVDVEENKVVLQTSPTSSITIHRQAIGRVVTPPVTDDETDAVTEGAVLNGEPISIADSSTPPTFGERVAEAPVTDVPTPEEPTPGVGKDSGRAGATNSKRAAE